MIVRAQAARLPGLNPPSLWHDDLVCGTIIRSESFLDMVPCRSMSRLDRSSWGAGCTRSFRIPNGRCSSCRSFAASRRFR